MTKPIRKGSRRIDSKRKSPKEGILPLRRENFYIIGAGLVVILAGYLAMLGAPVEGFLPLVLAPTLLVLGYCVIIPVGIMFKKSYLRRGSGGGNDTAGQQPGTTR